MIVSLCLVEHVCVNRLEQDGESKAQLNKAFAELEKKCKGHRHVMQQCQGHEYGIALMTMDVMLRMVLQKPNEPKCRSLPPLALPSPSRIGIYICVLCSICLVLMLCLPELCSTRVLPHPLPLLAAG